MEQKLVVAEKPSHALALITNILTTRLGWLRRLLDPRRNIDQECGHPCDITPDDYWNQFTRKDMARRIIKLYPEGCWKRTPDVYETEEDQETPFEIALDALCKKFDVYSYLERLDFLSGIGRFGVLLLGINDKLPLNMPVEGIGPDGAATPKEDRQLLYLRPFDEHLVTVKQIERDVTNPRFGMPVMYNIMFSDTAELGDQSQREVHWTRVIHVADNKTNSEIYGCPTLEVVFDRLLDLQKVVGGSGEMFWKGAFPGISLEAPVDGETRVVFDKEATKAQLEDYMNGLQRYIALVGMQAKSLAPQVADPNPHAMIQIQLIAAALGVPMRVLMGSEQAQLASGQDMVAWNERLDRRRKTHVEYCILRQFCDRLIDIGILPAPAETEAPTQNEDQPAGYDGYDYIVDWPDLNTPSDLDKSTVASNLTNAMAKYVQTGMDVLIPTKQYLTGIIGMTDEEAEAAITDAETESILSPPPEPGPLIVPPDHKVIPQ